VTDSTFSNNSASSGNGMSFGGGIDISQTGTVTVTNSTFSGNKANSSSGNDQGGGIDNDGKMSVTNSTFSNNAASSGSGTSFGGGVAVTETGKATVTNSTFSGNEASSSSGNSVGGGIENSGKLTVINNTIFGNETISSQSSLIFGGGIYNYTTGTLAVTNSTILNNTASSSGGNSQGGGIANDGTVALRTSIIVANSAREDPDILGTLISGGYNLLTDVTGTSGLNSSIGDQQVTLANLKIDSILGNNGGPTQTLKLLSGSIAIDVVPQQACNSTITNAVSGQKMTITTDQRGNPRPDGSENVCDVGAYESSY
jgi:hypothetical protein